MAYSEYAPVVTTFAVIPIKSFVGGKERLSRSLEPGARAALGRAMADHTLRTVEDAGFLPVVVTPDSDVAGWAGSLGVPALADPGTGLSAAAAEGVSWAREMGGSWVVIHADLPLVQSTDLTSVLDAIEAGGQPIAPSSDGGTSLVGSESTIPFAYGTASFHRHLRSLRTPMVIARLGLLHDLDTPGDLESALGHSRGAWLRPLLAAMSILLPEASTST